MMVAGQLQLVLCMLSTLPCSFKNQAPFFQLSRPRRRRWASWRRSAHRCCIRCTRCLAGQPR
jgi:hypothetical protein